MTEVYMTVYMTDLTSRSVAASALVEALQKHFCPKLSPGYQVARVAQEQFPTAGLILSKPVPKCLHFLYHLFLPTKNTSGLNLSLLTHIQSIPDSYFEISATPGSDGKKKKPGYHLYILKTSQYKS